MTICRGDQRATLPWVYLVTTGWEMTSLQTVWSGQTEGLTLSLVSTWMNIFFYSHRPWCNFSWHFVMTRVTVYNCKVTTQTTRAINRCSGETPETRAIPRTGSRQGRSPLARMDGFPAPGSARHAPLSVINCQSSTNTLIWTINDIRRKNLGPGEWAVSRDAGQGPGQWDRGHPEAWQRQDRVERVQRTGRGWSSEVKIKNVHLPPWSFYDWSMDLLGQFGNHYGQVRTKLSSKTHQTI